MGIFAGERLVHMAPPANRVPELISQLMEWTRTAQVTDQVTDQVAKLLSALGTDTLSGKELMERMGLSHRQSFRKSYLLPALAQNQIEITLPDRPNSSKQKYRKANPKGKNRRSHRRRKHHEEAHHQLL